MKTTNQSPRFIAPLALGAAIATLILASPAAAVPITWEFSGSAGNLGTREPFTAGGVTIVASAYYVDSRSGGFGYTGTKLWQRAEAPDDLGIGVCNPGDEPNCGGPGNGFFNELDSNGPLFDIIRLEVVGLPLLSLGLASVDDHSGIDNFRIYLSDLQNPDLRGLTPFAQGGPSFGGPNPTVPLSGTFRFVYIAPGTFGNGDDNFLVRNLTADVSAVPEPGSLLLLGSALAGVGISRRRRRKG